MSAEKLIIYFNNGINSQSGILHSTGSFEKLLGPLSEVAAREFAEIIVIAPPDSVLIMETALPKMPKPRLLQALPFALEEHLLADVGELHFAIPPLKKFAKDVSEINVTAAIVSKNKLQQWIHDLTAQGIYPTSLLAAPLLLNLEDNCWTVFIDDTFSMLRTSDFAGSTCDTANLNEYLSFKLHEAVSAPQVIYLYNFSQQKLNLSLDVNTIEKPVGNDSILDFFAKNIASPNINLLQGTQKAKRKGNESKKLWKIIPILAASWILLLLISNGISYFALHHQEKTLQTGINTIYKANFPHATSVVAIKQRLTEKLNGLSNGGQKNHFLIWLSALGQLLADNQNFHMQQLDYRDNMINIQFTADNFASVDTIIKGLRKQGISAKQQNVSEVGKGVKGVLVISEGNVT